jgi:endonuclease YncB( thermonuclease family)
VHRERTTATVCAWLVFAVLVTVSWPSQAAARASYEARVTSVVDGDTLWVRRSKAGPGTEIRLQGIDAPEICQRWGHESREALRALVLSRTVTVSEIGRDTYGRVLARLHVRGQDVGGWLVANGHAWSSHFHGHAGPYARLEVNAREARRGLWSQRRPLEPRAFRRQHGACPH